MSDPILASEFILCLTGYVGGEDACAGVLQRCRNRTETRLRTVDERLRIDLHALKYAASATLNHIGLL